MGIIGHEWSSLISVWWRAGHSGKQHGRLCFNPLEMFTSDEVSQFLSSISDPPTFQLSLADAERQECGSLLSDKPSICASPGVL